MIPCLKESNSYWIKHQYPTYSKDQDIWTTFLSELQPHISLRPWSMQCDRGNTTCIHLPGVTVELFLVGKGAVNRSMEMNMTNVHKVV